MQSIGKLLNQLRARLPELEWKIAGMSAFITTKKLPPGLFRCAKEANGLHCIAEIKTDIQDLSQQTNPRAANYLAMQIERKINVLVCLCQTYQKQNKPQRQAFGVESLSTRQQWIQSLENEILDLSQQRQALEKTLAKADRANSALILGLQSELGEVVKCLTKAQETLGRATT